jgi:hypothetical protein
MMGPRLAKIRDNEDRDKRPGMARSGPHLSIGRPCNVHRASAHAALRSHRVNHARANGSAYDSGQAHASAGMMRSGSARARRSLPSLSTATAHADAAGSPIPSTIASRTRATSGCYGHDRTGEQSTADATAARQRRAKAASAIRCEHHPQGGPRICRTVAPDRDAGRRGTHRK